MQTSSLGTYQLSQFMLGTVQFGLPYGVANTSGQPTLREVCEILEIAYAGGVNCLDTAPFYGESEDVLGRALEETGLKEKMAVVSKCLRNTSPGAPAAEAAAAAEEEITNSLKRLKLETLPICLTHIEENFRFVDVLLKLKERGLIQHIGASSISPEGTRALIETGLCEAVQLPTSILDRRFSSTGVLKAGLEKGVAIFVRSTYLQGLILMEPDAVPDDLRAVSPTLRELRTLAAEAGLGIEELALRYVMGLEGVTSLVVGVENREQVAKNLAIFGRGPLEPELMQRAQALVIDLPDLIFEPWRWQKRMPDGKIIPPSAKQRRQAGAK